MKLKHLLIAFLATTSLLLGSCSKELELSGTTWTGTAYTEGTDGSNLYEYTQNYIMRFSDDKSGYIYINMTYTVNGGSQQLGPSGSLKFTYTFDGKEGKMEATNQNTGQPIIDVFRYDEETQIITLYDGGVVVELKQK